MKTLITTLTFLTALLTATADESIREWTWDEPVDAAVLRAATVIPADSDIGFARLKIENPTGRPLTVMIFSIDDPGISADQYRLEGNVSYEDVDGEGYLELLNYFPGRGPFFSRTVGNTAATKALTGSSDWRGFLLPFFINDGSGMRPTKLEFNLVLPGKGTVYLGSVRLTQGAVAGLSVGETTGWWTEQQAGWIGGILGSFFGCLGALIGVLVGRGRCRRLVMAVFYGAFVVSGVLMAIGIAAVVLSQPWHVYYPVVLTGFIGAVVLGSCLPTARKRYDQIEFRKMQALDANST